MRLILAIALVVFAAAAPRPVRHGTGVAIPLVKQGVGFLNSDKSANLHAIDFHAALAHVKISSDLDSFDENAGTKNLEGSPIEPFEKRDSRIDLTPAAQKWYAEVSVGTPPSSFKVAIDTGSGSFFLLDKSCANCEGKPLYDPASSTTSVTWGEEFKVMYADTDKVSGDLYTDTVSIGEFTATTQTIGVASSASPRLTSAGSPFTGFVGFATRNASSYRAMPLFESLVLEGKVSKPVFSIKLASPKGELYLGGVDSSQFEGTITYTPVTSTAYWNVTMDNIQRGDTGDVILNSVPAIIDTGSNFVLGPTSDVAALHNAIGGTLIQTPGRATQLYRVSCTAMPPILFSFGGMPFAMPSYDLGPIAPGSSECISGIIGLVGRKKHWIIGQSFLQSVYVTFDYGSSLYDYDNYRVGFARLASSSQA